MIARSLLVGALLTALAPPVFGQAVLPFPYSSQLRTAPEVGNVQGVQRYGRALRTDPDQGEGFSYHVYPVAHPQDGSAVVINTGGVQQAPAQQVLSPTEPDALRRLKAAS